MRIIAFVTEAAPVERILTLIGVPAQPPAIAFPVAEANFDNTAWFSPSTSTPGVTLERVVESSSATPAPSTLLLLIGGALVPLLPSRANNRRGLLPTSTTHSSGGFVVHRNTK